MKKNSKFLIFVGITLVISSCGILRDSYQIQMNYLAPQHSLESNIEYQIIWNLSDIQAPTMTGTLNKIIIEGLKKGDNFKTTIFGVDSKSGDIMWEISGSTSEKIIANNNTLYRGTVGTTTVYAHNIDNGKLLWSTWLPSAHSTVTIYLADNKIFVFSNDDEFYVLDEQGNILNRSNETTSTFLEIDGVFYISRNYSLIGIDFSSRKELWELNIGKSFTSPIFNEGEIFLKTRNYSSDIYSIDRYTGKINWVISQNVRSNLCLCGDKIYFTSSDGELVAIDRYSGNEISRIKFSPKFDLNKQIGNYSIACDVINNVLALSFGDNTQIMGLKIMNP